MRVLVVAVGKPHDAALAAAIRDYESRAARYWPLEAIEVREESSRRSAVGDVPQREGTRLLAKVPAGAYVVACAVGGEPMTSAEFARWLQRQRERAEDTAFVIGGAFGLGSAVVRAARRSLALAPWTLPHELARLVLAEQLYRAGTIVRGEPYHK